MGIFDMLIWGGAALTLAGLATLVWCIVAVARARRASQTDEALRATMRRVLMVNMAALGVSALGLMTVVLGIVLGN
ncbi:hypothetical protein [Paracoccus sp. (in: a-proteobacteria)]|uniref:hypothetical protein n=1 Tax=Paracoccus sp. TaxID=267 RepID=UPI003A8826F6